MEADQGISRRRVLAAGLAVAAGAGLSWPVSAARLLPTPAQTRGPFYPVELPLDHDNDLVRVGGAGRRAKGTVAHVFGRVLDADGRAVRGARVEIWQCDANGVYHHPRDNLRRADLSFQGYGNVVTDEDGAYRFRTIRPVPYPGRTPHIHFAVKAPGSAELVTQMYVKGEPRNGRDFVLGRIGDAKARARVIVDLLPAPQIEAGALAGKFDIVLGLNAT